MKTSFHIVFGLLILTVFFPLQVPGDERDDCIRALEKRLEQLEKLLHELVAKPAPPREAPKPAEAPILLHSITPLLRAVRDSFSTLLVTFS